MEYKYAVTINKNKKGKEMAFRVTLPMGQMYRIGLAEAKLAIQTGEAKQIDWKPITRLEW